MPWTEYPKLAEGFLLRPPPTPTTLPPEAEGAEDEEDAGGRDATASKLVEGEQLRLDLAEETEAIEAEKREDDRANASADRSGQLVAANDKLIPPLPGTADPISAQQLDAAKSEQAEPDNNVVTSVRPIASINNRDELVPIKASSSDSEVQAERAAEQRSGTEAKAATRTDNERKEASVGEVARRDARIDTAEDEPRRQHGRAEAEHDADLDNDDHEAGL